MPGFHLYTSNCLEKLSEKLAGMLRSSPLAPLQAEIVVVQSRGMERWLNLEIARCNAISANITFPFPRAFVYDAFREVLDLPGESSFSPEIMAWKIMKILPGLIDKPGFESLKHYVAGDNGLLKRYQLSEKIAAVLDQYLVYRPDIITEWDQGKNSAASEFKHAAWQAELWQHISRADGSEQPLHHAALKNLFMKKIQAGASPISLPPRIFIFGISTLPPFYIEVFSGLARTIDIHFFYLNPCREYWEYAYNEKEIARFIKDGLSDEDQHYEKGNSLLASMGVSGREFFSLLLSAVGDTGEALFEEPGQQTMLQRIQSDILHLTDPAGPSDESRPLQGDDTSIQIHSCYSAMREIEVLYDNLLHLFDAGQNLLPKDIVVMTPDIATYAPLVQAVFDTPEDEHLKIPYSIADTSIRMESSIAAVFFSILTIDQQRFRAPAVLDILKAQAVRKKFDLTEKDVEAITAWVSKTGICWGIDGQYRTGLGLPGVHENSWAFGLDRMVLGYALPEQDPPALFSGILPFGEIEGSSALALGSFTRFMEALFNCNRMLQLEHTLTRWSDELCGALDAFFIIDDETEHELKEIRDALTEAGLAGFALKSGYDEKVPLDIIRACLGSCLEARTRRHGFISRGVTFCTMLPMRSIPFKVVYLLGMNDGDYPRSFSRPGFDLMEHRRRLCDRSKRHEDRFIFLESMLSAREHLIISYAGQSIKDNAHIPPSVLVCELEDYIRGAFGESALEKSIIRHPLQPFSPKYFARQEKKLFTYSKENFLAAAEALRQRAEKPLFIQHSLPAAKEDEWQAVSVDDLCRFFANPAEFLIKNRLRIGLRLEEAPEPEEREPFELDRLQQYGLMQDIAAAHLAGHDVGSLYDSVRASGRLPAGSSGESEYQALQDEAAAFSREVAGLLKGGAAEPREVVLELDDPRLSISGKIKSLYTQGQIFYRCANIKAKDRLRAWIWHLVLHSCGEGSGPGKTIVIGRDAQLAYAPLPQALAVDILKNLAGFFVHGLSLPLPFFPETSYAYAEALLKKGKSDAEALKAAEGKWRTGNYSRGESDDVYSAACFGSELPAEGGFKDSARAVFAPMLEHTEK